MKVIAFSLWGDNPKYTVGAIKNAKLAKKFYPDWEMRVYHNNSVPDYILKILRDNDVVLVNKNVEEGHCNAMWRFSPASEEGVECFICRDADSRIFERDVESVNEWLKSDKKFHIIRDHPGGHMWEITAGIWGCKSDFIKDIQPKMDAYNKVSPWVIDRAVDQRFLQEIIYPQAIQSLLSHDEYFHYERYDQPNVIRTHIKRDRKLNDFAFLCEPFDENDIQIHPHREMIKQKYIQRY